MERSTVLSFEKVGIQTPSDWLQWYNYCSQATPHSANLRIARASNWYRGKIGWRKGQTSEPTIQENCHHIVVGGDCVCGDGVCARAVERREGLSGAYGVQRGAGQGAERLCGRSEHRARD